MKKQQGKQYLGIRYDDKLIEEEKRYFNHSDQQKAKFLNDVDSVEQSINLNSIYDSSSFFNRRETQNQSQQIKQCIANKQAFDMCISRDCGKKPYICDDRKCFCHQFHQKCQKQDLQYLLKQTQKIKGQIKQQIKQCITKNQFIETLTNQCLSEIVKRKQFLSLVSPSQCNQIRYQPQDNLGIKKLPKLKKEAQMNKEETKYQNFQQAVLAKSTFYENLIKIVRFFWNYKALLIVLIFFLGFLLNMNLTISKSNSEIKGIVGNIKDLNFRVTIIEQEYSKKVTHIDSYGASINQKIQRLEKNVSQLNNNNQNNQQQIAYFNSIVQQLQKQNNLALQISLSKNQMTKSKSAQQKTGTKRQQQFRTYLLDKLFKNDAKQLQKNYNRNQNLQQNQWASAEWLQSEYGVQLSLSKFYLVLAEKQINIKEFIKNSHDNQIQYLWIYKCGLDDAHWRLLKENHDQFGELKILGLFQNKISSVQSEDLQKFPLLELVDLRGNPLSDESIKSLKQFKAKHSKVTIRVTKQNWHVFL